MAPDSPSQLFAARWVAPMDAPAIRDGAILTRAGRIIDVGRMHDVAKRQAADEVHDLGNVVVLPGLVNAHAHLELSDTPRPGDRWDAPLADWLIEVMKSAPPDGDATRIRRAIDAGVAQCLRFGVTTVGDITRQPVLTRPLLQKTPLRVTSFGEVQALAGRRHLLKPRLDSAVDGTYASGQLRIGVSPHAPYSIDERGYAACLSAAQERGLPLATHLAESPDEAEFIRQSTGPFRRIWDFLNAWSEDGVPRFTGGPVRYAKQLGLLDVSAVLAHVNDCDDEELALLAGGKASVVYCPRTHTYFGHPPHRWQDMLAAGVNVAIGTDSLASSPDLNLVDDLRLVRRLAPDVSAMDLWRLITTNAARALQRHDSVGSLTPGKHADLTCFRVPEACDDPLDAVLRDNILPSNVLIAGHRVTPGVESPTL